MPKSKHPKRMLTVAVIAFDGISPFHLSVPCLVFGGNGLDPGISNFVVKVCALDGKALRTEAGFSITTQFKLDSAKTADIVIVPSWHDDCREAPPALLEVLKSAHHRGATVVGLCLGAFPLAQAGLLDGRTATTHWQRVGMMAEQFPQVTTDENVLYVDQDNILTSAGVAAGLDCCFHLLRRLSGADVATRRAKRLLIAPHRQGGQAQFIDRPIPVSSSDNRLAQVMEWITQNLEKAHSIESLAKRAVMSRRNFTRHFRQATGTSYKQWVLNQRVAHAQRMLESSDAPIEVVAQQAGFGTTLSLRQNFKAVLHISPMDYRKQFRTTISDKS
jgi:transcriptional regulator GlxA family with amidase domain